MKTLWKALMLALPMAVHVNLTSARSTVPDAHESPVSYDDEPAHTSGNEWHLSMGFGYGLHRSYDEPEDEGLIVFVNGRYQWQGGLFVEVPAPVKKLAPGITLGYHFHSDDHWHFDVIAQAAYRSIQYSEPPGDGDPLILDRKSTMRLGLRMTGDYKDIVIQVIASPYSLRQAYNGNYLALWLGREWLIKNWVFHGAVGLQYHSSQINNYYYGVSDELATEITPAYYAGAGIDTTLAFSANYPLTKNWVFEASIRFTRLSDSVTDSPVVENLLQDDGSRNGHPVKFGLSLNYVF